MSSTPEKAAALGVNESACAEALQVSVAWLRKDRRGPRLIPFYRLGTGRNAPIRYNIARVAEALAQLEEGGHRPVRGRSATGRRVSQASDVARLES